MNILITGAGSVMGQSIFKALAMYDFGEPINVHFANSEPLGAGRFFSTPSAKVCSTPIFPLAADSHYSDFLENFVACNGIDIVFSGTQHELAKIAAFRDRTFKAATISSEIAEICMDKIRTSAVLETYGIQVPKTWSLSDYLDNSVNCGAVIVKPNYSSSSRKIFCLNSRDAVEQLVADGLVSRDTFLVQELLTGTEYTCGCYIDRYTKQISNITFLRTLTPDGATFYGEIVEDDKITDYVKAVASALIAEGLDFGHINVQLLVTASGPVLFEINGRLSSTEASKAHYGFNSCAAFVTNVVMQQPFNRWQTAHRGKFLRYYEEVYFD